MTLEEKRKLAQDQKTDPNILAVLSQDDDVYVKYCIAENISTPPYILSLLSQSNLSGVRSYIAINTSTPLEALNNLSHDGHAGVSYLARDTLRNLKMKLENDKSS